MRSRPSLRSVAAVLAILVVATSGAASSAAADPGPGSRWDDFARRKAAAQETAGTAGVDDEVSAAAVGQFTDPFGDENPFRTSFGDIREYTADYGYEVLGVSMLTNSPSSPMWEYPWTIGATFLAWSFDVNGDLADDYIAVFFNDGSGVVGHVFDVRSGSFVKVCDATPNWNSNVFGLTFPPACIGSPSAIRVQAYAQYDEAPEEPTCVCPYDVAPDGFGFSPWIVRALPVGDGPGVASSDPGTVDVFVRGQDNALWTQRRDGSWGGWSSLNGIITGTPAAASAAAGELDVFVRGQDNALWTRHREGATWGGWRSLGGILTTPPAVVSSAPGTLDAFVAGNDRALYVNHFDGSTWSGWARLGGILTATPAAASRGPGTVDVFVRGQDNALHTQRHNGVSWSGWQLVGGIIASAPSAASTGPGSVDVFARGPDEALWAVSSSSVGSPWGGWVTLGGVISTPPAAVSAAAGTLDVFARGQDYALWTMHRDGIWGPWTSLGGIIR